MPATDTTLWDYAVSYGGPSLFMTAVFLTVMPLVWFKFARPRLRRWPSRLAVMLSVWMFAWFIAYGDVLLIAREAKRVCEAEAGLRVYQRANAEGFAGSDDIQFWSSKGFRFVEKERDDGVVYRYAIGMPPQRLGSSAEMISRYKYEYWGLVVSEREGGFIPNKRVIRDLETGQVLGELVRFSVPYGWIDGYFSAATGAENLHCEGGAPVHQDELRNGERALIMAVLQPIK